MHWLVGTVKLSEEISILSNITMKSGFVLSNSASPCAILCHCKTTLERMPTMCRIIINLLYYNSGSCVVCMK